MLKKFAWTTPSADGQTLLSPSFTDLKSPATSRWTLPSDLVLGGMAASDLRDLTRIWLAANFDVDPSVPIVATGHQCEFYHPGVWFKDLVIARLAEHTGATALHFAADMDTPAHRELVIPRCEDGEIILDSVSVIDAPDGHVPAFIPAPKSSVTDLLDSSVENASLAGKLYWLWRAAAVSDTSGTLSGWFTSGREAVNSALGLDIQTVAMSKFVKSEPFARFTASLIYGGQRLFSLHGRLLAEHRHDYGIRNSARPVPDLARTSDGSYELPLWLICPGEPRSQLLVRYKADHVEILAGERLITDCPHVPEKITQAIMDLPGSSGGWIIAPKALTLTMFLRLFAVDIFVHGTGGARYDILGDELAKDFYGIRPPQYVTATATLRLDLPRRKATATDLAAARHRLHHLHHNPVSSHDVSETASRVRELPDQIAAAERSGTQRRELFQLMHELKDTLRALDVDRRNKLQAELDSLSRDLEHNRAAMGREYFFAFFGRVSLLSLSDSVDRWLKRN